ncbi:hypothetical protein K440DRAFT_631046 [Wilcoxina mikolae CBS 423.85]|nr:hypothetical protein K440DRAFT_631046 [Wilcoxina mikolae CBS 423.85]
MSVIVLSLSPPSLSGRQLSALRLERMGRQKITTISTKSRRMSRLVSGDLESCCPGSVADPQVSKLTHILSIKPRINAPR